MVTLSPVSNLLFINSSTLSERFLFVPSLAFCIAIVHLSARWLKTDLSSGTVLKRTPLLIGFLAIVGIGAVVTRTEAAFWKDNITLFEHGVQAAPNSVRTHYNLATEYWKLALKSNDPAKAKELSDASIRHFNRSLELLPENFMCMTNLGCLYDLRDDFDSSYHFFKKSLQLNANQPVVYTNLSKIHLKKGSALERSGDIAGAIAYYRKSFSFDSTDIAPLNAIALTYGNRQRYDSATVWLQAALRLQPNDRTTIENAAVIAFFEKRYDASIALAGKSISLFGNSKRMLGVMADSYHALGNDSAVARYVQLIRQFPQ
jgi:tetratricopeptide (TPR) repeat protein